VRSRMATIESLVERGTFRIDESDFSNTIDKVWIKGHFYSDKPPMLALIGAPSYYAIRALEIKSWRLGEKYTGAVITLATLGISCLLCLACFYDALRWTGIADKYRLIMTASLGLATLYLPWNLTFNNHGFTASWLFIGFYCMLRARKTAPRRNVWLFLSGLSLGDGGSGGQSSTLFFVLSPRMYWRFRNSVPDSCITRLRLRSLCCPVSHQLVISGSIRPVHSTRKFFHYPGSHWLTGQEALFRGEVQQRWFLPLRYAVNCPFRAQGSCSTTASADRTVVPGAADCKPRLLWWRGGGSLCFRLMPCITSSRPAITAATRTAFAARTHRSTFLWFLVLDFFETSHAPSGCCSREYLPLPL